MFNCGDLNEAGVQKITEKDMMFTLSFVWNEPESPSSLSFGFQP